jgi:hypothetical protein
MTARITFTSNARAAKMNSGLTHDYDTRLAAFALGIRQSGADISAHHHRHRVGQR